MKEIKIWKVILIWFIVPVAVSLISTILLLILNPYKEINVVLILFISFLSMLLIILMLGKVNSKLITERYKDLKCKFNIKEIISGTVTQIFL